MGDAADDVFWNTGADCAADEELEPCPTCKGRKTVNPLTAPDRPGFLCLGTTLCPDCDGSGLFDW